MVTTPKGRWLRLNSETRATSYGADTFRVHEFVTSTVHVSWELHGRGEIMLIFRHMEHLYDEIVRSGIVRFSMENDQVNVWLPDMCKFLTAAFNERFVEVDAQEPVEAPEMLPKATKREGTW